MINRDNIDKENVFFSLDENVNNDNDNNNDNSHDLIKMLDDFDSVNQMNNLTNEEITEVMFFEYKINYTVKGLLLICEYYGIAKELKNNNYNKEEIIYCLVNFENNPLNSDIVLRRQGMWYYISQLKSDKFMKKYVLW